jgi:hypothetical protein
MGRSVQPTISDLIREIDMLRGTIRFAEGIIRKLNRSQHVDVPLALQKLAAVRAESKRITG